MCSSVFRRLLSIGVVAFLAAPLVVSHALAGDVVHYQAGVAHAVLVDDTHVIIVTDGRTPHIELALSLAAEGVSDSLAPVGDLSTTLELGVAKATPELIDALISRPGITAAYPVIRFRQGGQPFGVTNDVIVKFRSAVTDAERRAFESQYDLAIQNEATKSMGLGGVFAYKVLGDDALNRVSALHADDRLADWRAHADLHAPIILNQSAPQDEFFDLQWHLENDGDFPGSVHADIDVFDAWTTTMGSGIRIGMFDTGCDIEHEDLADNYLGVSQNNYGSGGEIFAVGGHGTAVMGLMVAGANSIGVRGVAPEARFTASSFGGGFATTAAAYKFAVNNGVDVHNNSWGFAFGLMPDVVVEAIRDAANTGRDGRGMVIAFASGNSATELEPGADLSTLAEVIQVGATGQSDVIASYSNFGVTQDIMGPTLGDDGVGLATTDITGSDGFNDGSSFFDISNAPNYTRRMSGTSGASPVVTGVAALVLAVNPSLNRHQVLQLLTHSADKVSRLDAEYGAVTSFSPRYGYGRVNAARAVEAAVASRTGNVTWPGIPQDISIRISEAEQGLVATIGWDASGMPDGDGVASEEQEVVLFYRVPSQEGPDEIGFAPDDGDTFEPCDPTQFANCILPDPLGSPNLAVIFSGVPEIDDSGGNQGRRTISGLPIAGSDEDDEQRFALFAVNSQRRYSFGTVFDENGDVVDIGGGDDGSGIVPPPDQGRPIDPELIPEEPGKNEPPSVTATADRTVCSAPCTVEFHGGAVTPNQILDRGWSFGDGATSSEDAIRHTYQLPGTYNAVYFAVDDEEPNGRISTKLIQVQIDVDDQDGDAIVPGTASARIAVQSTIPVFAPDARVRFIAETTGIGESTNSASVTYQWDFGDGNTGTGQSAENIYANPGFFSVVVVVTEQLTSGQEIQAVASTILQVDGFSTNSGQSQPTTQGQTTTSDSDNGSAGACGVMGLASLALGVVGMWGLGYRRRRRF